MRTPRALFSPLFLRDPLQICGHLKFVNKLLTDLLW